MKAVNTFYELSADDRVCAEYEQRQKVWRDRDAVYAKLRSFTFSVTGSIPSQGTPGEGHIWTANTRKLLETSLEVVAD